MGTKLTARRRCTECRKYFHPSPRAIKSQKVCSQECRRTRNRRLAYRRRRDNLEEYRKKERERQRQRRAKHRKQDLTATASRSCHTQPLSAKRLNLKNELLANWDMVFNMSRATFCRKITMILRTSDGISGTGKEAFG